MAYLELDQSLHLGHEIIDQDHQGLANAINELVDALFAPTEDGKAGERRAHVDVALARLRERAETHFREEEWIMQTSEYPALDSHHTQHESLLADLDSFAAHFNGPSGDSAAHAVRFLREWFEFHIHAWDTPLVQWLNERAERK